MNDAPATDTEAVERFLRARGAQRLGHAHGRSLLDHLLETRSIVARWLQRPWVQNAAALHSVYGTDFYRTELLPLSVREQVQTVAGLRAERLAYLFAAVKRHDLFGWFETAGSHAGVGPTLERRFADDAAPEILSRREAGDLLVLHMANKAEQACDDGLPAPWLARVSRWGSWLRAAGLPAPPPFAGCSTVVGTDDEQGALAAYRAGLQSDDASTAAEQFAAASQWCPWVAEPWVWRAWLALAQGRDSEVRLFSDEARRRLVELGTTWDKRLTFDRWLALTDALSVAGGRKLGGRVPTVDWQRPGRSLDALTALLGEPGAHRHDDADRQRFVSYVESFVGSPRPKQMRYYPGLTARRRYDPARFGLVHALEANYLGIRDEIDRIDRNAFRPESERIARTGSWDVLMLYERGQKHDDACALCPVTTQVIDDDPSTPTPAGLIYVSRMSPGTHVGAHPGPTNMRLRCHLGIRIPEGDCGLRVGDEILRWKNGRCVVFDDHFNHEAWNHTAEDRVVLIVDIWHPDLSRREIELLQGLDHYAVSYARRVERYRAGVAAVLADD